MNRVMLLAADAWLWYRQYPAIWLHDAMYYLGLPFGWCIWSLQWAGVGYCADSFGEFRRFRRDHPTAAVPDHQKKGGTEHRS